MSTAIRMRRRQSADSPPLNAISTPAISGVAPTARLVGQVIGPEPVEERVRQGHQPTPSATPTICTSAASHSIRRLPQRRSHRLPTNSRSTVTPHVGDQVGGEERGGQRGPPIAGLEGGHPGRDGLLQVLGGSAQQAPGRGAGHPQDHHQCDGDRSPPGLDDLRRTEGDDAVPGPAGRRHCWGLLGLRRRCAHHNHPIRDLQRCTAGPVRRA